MDSCRCCWGDKENWLPLRSSRFALSQEVDSGRKHDQGKLRLDLLPPEAIEMLGRIYTHGAAKYGEGNWEHGFRPGQLLAAARRHDMAMAKGEWLDPETGIPHAFHAAWNYITLGVLGQRERQEEDG